MVPRDGSACGEGGSPVRGCYYNIKKQVEELENHGKSHGKSHQIPTTSRFDSQAWNVAEPGLHDALAKEPPQLVLEAAGTPDAVKLAVSLVAPGGTVILLGSLACKKSRLIIL